MMPVLGFFGRFANSDRAQHEPAEQSVTARGRETVVFLGLTAVVFPLLTVMFVAGYGFVVWMWQVFRGPPTGLG